jgi:hydroxyacylglutathione hydrolase
MSLNLKSYTLGELDTNCYLLWDEETLEAVVIDPAASGDFINQEILNLQLKPQAIWLTHGHFDHVLGLLEVKMAFGVPIWMHSDDQFLLKQATSSAKHWLKKTVDPVPPAEQFWQDGDSIKIGQHQFSVMQTPGHTPGSVSLYSAGNELLISGDTLFKNGIGRTDFSYSNHGQILESLQRLKTLPSQTKVFSGHGEATTIEAETK